MSALIEAARNNLQRITQAQEAARARGEEVSSNTSIIRGYVF